LLKRQELRTDLISVPPTIYSLPIESLNYQFYQLLLNQLENDLADHSHWFWKQDVLCTILCLKILLDSMIKKKKGGTQLITLVVRDSIKKLYIVGVLI
jgi:hypothetical protein